jgi:hypothetical protein
MMTFGIIQIKYVNQIYFQESKIMEERREEREEKES